VFIAKNLIFGHASTNLSDHIHIKHWPEIIVLYAYIKSYKKDSGSLDFPYTILSTSLKPSTKASFRLPSGFSFSAILVSKNSTYISLNISPNCSGYNFKDFAILGYREFISASTIIFSSSDLYIPGFIHP
jgi:hypothetical protein